MTFEHPAPEQVPLLKQLWHLAFGDEETVIDAFFETAYAPERCLALFRPGRAAAALYWLEGSCRGARLAYVYAVATHPRDRRQGLCRALMEQTHALLTAQGYAAAALTPAEPPLRAMYAGLGYLDAGGIGTFSCHAGDPAPVEALSAAAYAARRRQLLPEGGVIQEGPSMNYLARLAGLYAGPGCILAAVREGRTLRALELLGDPSAAPGIVAALGCEYGTFRTPGHSPFTMYRPLKPNVPPPGYLGLAFD